jgi:hypothetical protein
VDQRKHPLFLNKYINLPACFIKHHAIILNLSTFVEFMVSFMAWLIYAWDNKTLDKRLSYLHSWSELAGDNKTFWLCRNQALVRSIPAHTLVTTLAILALYNFEMTAVKARSIITTRICV